MHVTGLYAALATLLVLFLSGRVSWLRNKRKVKLGDGGLDDLARAIRAQANAVEYLPLALLLLLLLDLDQARTAWLHGLGVALVAGRVLHAWGLSRSAGRSPGRALGMLLTWGAMLAMALWLLWRHGAAAGAAG